MADSIVITGLGVVSPIGCSERELWDSLCRGRSGAATVDCLDTTELPRKVACQIHERVDAGEPRGRAAALAVAAARQAFADAGVGRMAGEAHSPSMAGKARPTEAGESHSKRRCSIVIGTTMGETEFIEDRLTAPAEQWLASDQMKRIVDARPGSIARNVQADLGLGGSAVDLYGACAAGNMAVATACRQLAAGRCDVALAGGADGFSRLAFIGFMRARVMSAGVCRPFDESRDGLLVGEGAAMFVLERESDAAARGARIRARVSGGAFVCESYHPTRPDPNGDGLFRSTQEALRRADLQPGDIDYVCAHGTGTPHNDAIEVAVMQACFSHGVPFSSIKALTGHTMGAAAAMEAVACVLSLEHQTLLPTWNLEKPVACEPLEAAMGQPRPARLRHVLNNSAGFGGYNSSIILSRV